MPTSNRPWYWFGALFWAVIIAAFFLWPTSKADTPVQHHDPRSVVGQFQSKTYDISDHEHVVAFDMPNRIVPSRCWTYVNETTRTSNMHCDSDEPGTDMPMVGPALDR